MRRMRRLRPAPHNSPESFPGRACAAQSTGATVLSQMHSHPRAGGRSGMPLHASSDSRGLARGESEEPWTALPPSRPTRLRVLVRARRVSDEQPWLLQDRRSVRSSGGGGTLRAALTVNPVREVQRLPGSCCRRSRTWRPSGWCRSACSSLPPSASASRALVGSHLAPSSAAASGDCPRGSGSQVGKVLRAALAA